MNEKSYKRKLDFQEKLVIKQSEQIKSLKDKIKNLELECKEKDEMINSVSSLREELKQSISDVKKHKNEYKNIINEIRKMKDIMNQEVYHGRWWLIRFLMK